MKQQRTEPPSGIDLLKMLIELLAEQEGVTIKYEIEEAAA